WGGSGGWRRLIADGTTSSNLHNLPNLPNLLNLPQPPPTSPTYLSGVSDLLAARSQMGVSLAFHIVFAVVGIAMPGMMVVAERRWRCWARPRGSASCWRTRG